MSSSRVRIHTLAALIFFAFPAFAQQATWQLTGSVNSGRHSHSSTLLSNGKVLIVGGLVGCISSPPPCDALKSAELFDPSTGTFKRLPDASVAHDAGGGLGPLSITVRLADGRVLLAGGNPAGTVTNASELFDPTTETWSRAADMVQGRAGAAAILLPNGRVLVTGGSTPNILSSSELYDPVSNTWAVVAPLTAPRSFHVLTLLPDGRILAAGGVNSSQIVNTTEIYDPVSNSWLVAPPMTDARIFHRAVLLPSGKVLVAGGISAPNLDNALRSAEIFDPVTSKWSSTGTLSIPRATLLMVLLSTGKVLAIGGFVGLNSLASAELYDASTGQWTATSFLSIARALAAASVLGNGKVLVSSGSHPSSILTSAELYDSGAPLLSMLSAASYSVGAPLAAKSIVSAYGVNLGGPGVTLKVKDSAGIEKQALIYFSSPNQINFQIPPDLASGPAMVTSSNGATGLVDLTTTSLGLFTSNATGTGAAAALDAVTGAAAPFNATRQGGEPNIIAFYCTGLGNDATDLDADAAGSVEARVNGIPAPVLYAGRAPGFPGTNQINVQLPAGLSSGSHRVTISRSGVPANPVTIAIR